MSSVPVLRVDVNIQVTLKTPRDDSEKRVGVGTLRLARLLVNFLWFDEWIECVDIIDWLRTALLVTRSELEAGNTESQPAVMTRRG